MVTLIEHEYEVSVWSVSRRWWSRHRKISSELVLENLTGLDGISYFVGGCKSLRENCKPSLESIKSVISEPPEHSRIYRKDCSSIPTSERRISESGWR